MAAWALALAIVHVNADEKDLAASGARECGVIAIPILIAGLMVFVDMPHGHPSLL